LAAGQRRILYFDNLSDMPTWLSDSFCRLSTGAAIERRKLFSDAELTAFIAMRPVILTGIRDVVDRPDLVSRTIKIDLPRVDNRKTEQQLFAEFKAAQPKILGWLLDGVSAALTNRSNTTIDDLPRLADWTIWCQAAEPGLGITPGVILDAYRESSKAAASDLLMHPLAQQIIGMEDFTGTATALADTLGNPTSPLKVRDMMKDLRDLTSTIETQGIRITLRPSHGKKIVEITKVK
jgi:hypothetical protein